MDKKVKEHRFTIDIPDAIHRRLKALAAIHGKSMKDLVLQSLDNILHEMFQSMDTNILKK